MGPLWQQTAERMVSFMTNIFVEGIQGAGKSTLVNQLQEAVPELKVCREGDYSPVELAWCARMTESEYEEILKKYPTLREDIIAHTVREKEHRIVMYTRIRTEQQEFYEELESFEIYNGRKSLAEIKEIVFSRYESFRENGYLFECAFFQNLVEDMILFHLMSDEEIMDFYRVLFQKVDKEQFILLYLYSENIEENIQIVRKERCDEEGREAWFQMMMEYFANSPYGQKYGYSTEADLIAHFQHRQQLELNIVQEVLGEKAVILPSKGYDIEEIIKLI